MNIWRDNYYLENDYNSKTKLSIIFSILHEKLDGPVFVKEEFEIKGKIVICNGNMIVCCDR